MVAQIGTHKHTHLERAVPKIVFSLTLSTTSTGAFHPSRPHHHFQVHMTRMAIRCVQYLFQLSNSCMCACANANTRSLSPLGTREKKIVISLCLSSEFMRYETITTTMCTHNEDKCESCRYMQRNGMGDALLPSNHK